MNRPSPDVPPRAAVIRAAAHPLARTVRALGRGATERRVHGLFLVEGPRGLAEALEAGARPAWVLAAVGRATGEDPSGPVLRRCREAGIAVHPVDPDLLERIAPAEHGPGLVAACRLPAGADDPAGLLAAPGDGRLVVCWGIQNPGSLGALLRSAAAFGARGLLAAGGADPWNPKSVRASAGAIHRLPAARAAAGPELVGRLHAAGYRLVAAVPRGGAAPAEIDWTGRVALLLGAEVAGLPDEVARAARRVTIPTSGAVESLSVPIAGAILLSAGFSAGR